MLSFLHKKKSQRSCDKIVPLIKPAGFHLANIAIFQDKLSEDEIIPQLPIYRPFIGDIVIAYAFDSGDRYEFISERKLSKLGLNMEELHEKALVNLYRLVPDLSVQDLGMYQAIVVGDDLEASTLLMFDVWEQLACEYDGALRMVAPTREAVYFRHNHVELQLKSGTLSSTWCFDFMFDIARSAREENPIRQVSNCIFEWSESGWSVIGELGKDLQQKA